MEETAFHGLLMGWAIGYRPSLSLARNRRKKYSISGQWAGHVPAFPFAIATPTPPVQPFG